MALIGSIEIKEVPIAGYEKVIEAIDLTVGLHCYIAIHDSTLGPALGGTRIFPYKTKDEALRDALRLSKAMTYKSAVAQDGLGGGKSVIIADPKKQKSEQLLLSFGSVIDTLQGSYIAAEDVGTTTEDMVIIKKRTPYVCALPTDKSSGDPSRFTAWGVFRGLEAVCKKIWHTRSLRHRTIAIQGLGNVGAKLANILFWEGANLLLSDIDPKKVHDLCHLYGASPLEPEDYFSTPCDILAPCAMGGIINDETIPFLQCRAIAGGANNQLLKPEHGLLLQEKNILYAPDYIINAGGILNAAAEFEPGGYNPKLVRDRVNRIYDTLLMVFQRSENESKPSAQVADEIAEYNLEHGIGRRKIPIEFIVA